MSAPRRLLGGLDPERLGNVGELLAQIVDGGGKFGRSADFDNLAARFQSRGDGGIGGDDSLDVGGDALPPRVPHSAWALKAAQAVEARARGSRVGPGPD